MFRVQGLWFRSWDGGFDGVGFQFLRVLDQHFQNFLPTTP